MSAKSRYRPTGPHTWVDTSEFTETPGARERCTIDFVADALGHLAGVCVVSVTVNETGTAQADPVPGLDIPMPPITDLPVYCDVRLTHEVPGGHTAQVTVWVPLAWNRRILDAGGGGNRTSLPGWAMPSPMWRGAGLPTALRNGFSVATTDAGNRDPRLADWGLDPETGELDRALMESWAYSGTHEMAVLSRQVVEAIHADTVRYAYFQGSSGGGRQAVAQAQRYPNDYDGLWAAEPAERFSRMALVGMWPALVMNNERNPLAAAKLAAFREAYVDAAARTGHPTPNADLKPFDWNPQEVVGASTAAGPITAKDAEVVAKIWGGPHRRNGEPLAAPMLPSTAYEGALLGPGMGLATTTELDGRVTPVPFVFSEAFLRAWVKRDPAWDWTTLGYDEYEGLFDQAIADFAWLDTPADFADFARSGAKLLLTHGTGDEFIHPQLVVDFHHDVIVAAESPEQIASCVAFFLCAGDSHSMIPADTPGVALATGMSALMNWVEHGIAPDSLLGEQYDADGTTIVATVDFPRLQPR